MRPYDFKDSVQSAVTFELNRDLRVVKRKVYMIMDWLGDIGGLSGSLYAMVGVFVAIFQYKVVYNYIATNTYRVKKNNYEVENFNISQRGQIKLSLQRLCKVFCCDCCKSQKDKLAHKADSLVKDELKIVDWIRFKRVTEDALERLVEPKLLK